MQSRVPTSLLAATGLIAGFGVAVGTGSRPLGGLVMAAFGLTCIYVWTRRDGREPVPTETPKPAIRPVAASREVGTRAFIGGLSARQPAAVAL